MASSPQSKFGLVAALLLICVVPMASARCSWPFYKSTSWTKTVEGCSSCVTDHAFMSSSYPCVWCASTGTCHDPGTEFECDHRDMISGEKQVCAEFFDRKEEETKAQAAVEAFDAKRRRSVPEQREILEELNKMKNDFNAMFKLEDAPALRAAMEDLLADSTKTKNSFEEVLHLAEMLDGVSQSKVYEVMKVNDHDMDKALHAVFWRYFEQNFDSSAATSLVRDNGSRDEAVDLGPELEKFKNHVLTECRIAEGMDEEKQEKKEKKILKAVDKLYDGEKLELSEAGKKAFSVWYLDRASDFVKKEHMPCSDRGNMKHIQGGLFSLAEAGERESSDPALKKKLFIILEGIVSVLYVALCFITPLGPFISLGLMFLLKAVRKVLDFEGKEEHRLLGIQSNKNLIRSMEAMTVATMVHYDHFVYPYAWKYSQRLDDLYERANALRIATGPIGGWGLIVDTIYEDKKELLDSVNKKTKRIAGYSMTQSLSEEVNWLHMLSESEGSKAVVRDMEKVLWWVELASVLSVGGYMIMHSLGHGIIEAIMTEGFIAEEAAAETAVVATEGAEGEAALLDGAGHGAEAEAVGDVHADALTDAHGDGGHDVHHGEHHGILPDPLINTELPAEATRVGVVLEAGKILSEGAELGHHAYHFIRGHEHGEHGHHQHGHGHVHTHEQGNEASYRRSARTIMCGVTIRDVIGHGIDANDVFFDLYLRESFGHTQRARESINVYKALAPGSDVRHDWSAETFQFAGVLVYFDEGQLLLTLKVWNDKHWTVGSWHSRRVTKTADAHKVGYLKVKLDERTVVQMQEEGRATMDVDQPVCKELLNGHDGDHCEEVGRLTMKIHLEKDEIKLGDGAEMVNLDIDVKKATHVPDASVFYNRIFVEGEALDMDSREHQSFKLEAAPRRAQTVVWDDPKRLECVLVNFSTEGPTTSTTDMSSLQSMAALRFSLAHWQSEGKTYVPIGFAEYSPDWGALDEEEMDEFYKGNEVSLTDKFERTHGYVKVTGHGQESKTNALSDKVQLYVGVKAERVNVDKERADVERDLTAWRSLFKEDTLEASEQKSVTKQISFTMRLMAAMWYSGVGGFTLVDHAKEAHFVSADRLQHALLEVLEQSYSKKETLDMIKAGRAGLAERFNAHSWESLFDAATGDMHSYKMRVTFTGDRFVQPETASLDGAPCESQTGDSNKPTVICDVRDLKEVHWMFVKTASAGGKAYRVKLEPGDDGLVLKHDVDLSLKDETKIQRLPSGEASVDSLIFPNPFSYLSRPPVRDPESQKIYTALLPFDGPDIVVNDNLKIPTISARLESTMYSDGWVKLCDTGVGADGLRPRGLVMVYIGKGTSVRPPVGFEHIVAIPEDKDNPETTYTSLWVADAPPGYRCFGSIAVQTSLENVLVQPPLSSVGCVPVAATEVWDMQNNKAITPLDRGTIDSGDALANELSTQVGDHELDGADYSKQEYRTFRGPRPVQQLVSTGHDTSANFPSRAVFTLREGHYQLFPNINLAEEQIGRDYLKERYLGKDSVIPDEEDAFPGDSKEAQQIRARLRRISKTGLERAEEVHQKTLYSEKVRQLHKFREARVIARLRSKVNVSRFEDDDSGVSNDDADGVVGPRTLSPKEKMRREEWIQMCKFMPKDYAPCQISWR